jgi:AraC-like DNA-binding protein
LRQPKQRTVAAGGLRKLSLALEAHGQDSGAWLAEAGIARNVLDDPDAVLDWGTFLQCFEDAALRVGDPALGRKLACAAKLEDFDVLGQVISFAPSIRTALGRLRRYYRLWTNGSEFSLRPEPEGLALRYTVFGADPEHCRQDVEFSLVAVISLLTQRMPGGWRPLRLSLMHDADVPALAQELGVTTVGSAPENCLVLPLDTIDQPLIVPSPRIGRVVQAYAEALLDAVPADSAVVAKVQKALNAAETTGDWEIAATAEYLGMPVRSLQRALNQEGTDYRTVVDQTRERRSRVLLLETGHGLAEIAFLLGFAEISSLVRAFRRWQGVSPTEFRRQMRSSSGEEH